MKLHRRDFLRFGPGGLVALAAAPRARAAAAPHFEPVQPELFAAAGGQPNCWADFDNDGDLDLFVGFKAGVPNRLYRNDNGTFVEVGADLKIADDAGTRAAGWGDFDADGNADLYVGFSRRSNLGNKLYHNDGHGKFVDVAKDLGVDAKGETRQISWVDFDNDGRVDLFVAFRDAPNMLFHNRGNHFVDVAKDMGVDDPRKTVGAVWFDSNQDGRLDVFTANQDGTLNGLYRNDGDRFVDVAHELGMDAYGRPSTSGSCGPSVADYDNDGQMDLFVAGYGGNFLFHNDGGGKFTSVADKLGVAGGEEATPSCWGDYDNDGRVDLYVSSYVSKPVNEKDYLYHNEGDKFTNALPPEFTTHGATHGIQWVDFDGNGALDLSIANNNPGGTHYLYRNMLPPEQARRSLQVMVLDHQGHATRAGSEVRIYAPGTRTMWGGRIVDTGSGYCSQNIMPVHFGLPKDGRVDVEVTALTKSGRKVTRVANVDPNKLPRRVLVVKLP